ncbi:MAG: molybdopterin oxidoreductase family protein, partial [Phaeodactylibacter sp.]|nr:molybdopterin oxidoreductase family protein [Phaeodactylibacter sp.]
AVALYMGNPGVHNTGTGLYFYDFANALGTRNRYASHSLDQLPQMFVNGEMFGHQALFPVPDIERTQFFLMLGANPVVSNGSVMSTPNIKKLLQDIQRRQGRVVVLDPRRTRTAELADQHLFIRPGMDVFFLLAFVHTLFEEELVRPNHAWRFTDGIAILKKAVSAYTPERVAGKTGVSAETIRRLARGFAGAERAICYGRLGVSTQRFGSLCHWLINAVNILTGNMDSEGGVMFPLPAIDFVRLLKREAKALRWQSRTRGLPEVAGDLPTAALAEEILTEGEGQVKALITIAGNPASSVPNVGRMNEALARLDFMVAIDIYLNETTRHADIILPPAAGLEALHYDFVLNIVAIRNVANFSPPVFSIGPDQRYDWQILLELQKRLERGNPLWLKAKHAVLSRLTPERRLNLGLLIGPYGKLGGRFLKGNGLDLQKLKDNPHGIDLGPLKPCLPVRLFTKNKRIQLLPPALLPFLEQAEAALEEQAPDGRFQLIGRRHLRSNNSWMHNSTRLMKGPPRCTAILHPHDAERLRIEENQLVTVRSKNGSIQLPAEISDEVMPGVISIPHGWGHDQDGVRLVVARWRPGVNVNVLTDDQLTDGPTGNAVFNGVWVEVEAVEQG